MIGNEVLLAIVQIVGTAVVAYAGVQKANNLTSYQIKELQKKVEKHNSIVERTFILEKKMEGLEKLKGV